jgi:hypothetical protein
MFGGERGGQYAVCSWQSAVGSLQMIDQTFK